MPDDFIHRDVAKFLDLEGRLKQWPTKQSAKEVIIGYLATKFALTANIRIRGERLS